MRRITGAVLTRGRARLAVLACVIAAAASYVPDAGAQQIPVGTHYGARGADSGFGSGTASPTGSFELSAPIALPPARGGLPIPFELRYSGGSHVGEGGVGWVIPPSYVVRQESLTRRRPDISGPDPSAAPRVALVLNGAVSRMIETGDRSYQPMVGGQNLRLSEHSDDVRWVLRDGSGRTFWFEGYRADRERLAGLADLPIRSMYMLTRITDRRSKNEVRLNYEANASLSDIEGPAFEFSLESIDYNFHPEEGCAKHRLQLHYGKPHDAPSVLALSVQEGHVRARTDVLVGIEVLAIDGASCDVPPRRLDYYQLGYERDADTGMPRLTKVDRLGQTGTDEESITLACYGYGAATRDGRSADPPDDGVFDDDVVQPLTGTLAQQQGPCPSAFPQLPSSGRVLLYRRTNDVPFPDDSDLVAEALGSTHKQPGSTYETRHVVQDFTGDGLPDLLFPKDAEVWLAPNFTGFNGTSFDNPDNTVAPLFTSFSGSEHSEDDSGPPSEADFRNQPLSQQTLWGGSRYSYGARVNFEDTFTQVIDFNGDGRLDVVHAREMDHWDVFYNFPGSDGQPDWVWRPVGVKYIREELKRRGYPIDIGGPNPLPLARSSTGQNGIGRTWCRGYDGDEQEKWVDLEYDRCEELLGPAPQRRLWNWRDQHSFLQWKLVDINGDGYPDFVFNSLPVNIVSSYKEGCAPDYGEEGELDGPFNPEWCHELKHVVLSRTGVTGDEQSGRNELLVFYNQGGAQIGAEDFSHNPKSLPGSGECALEYWPASGSRQEMQCGLSDVNGDGLLDRVLGRDVRLGTGEAFVTVPMRLPGRAFASSNGRDICPGTDESDETSETDETRTYLVRQTRAVIDVTGDGIPDYVSEDNPGSDVPRVYVGTGTSFNFDPEYPESNEGSVPIHGGFALSVVEETCDEGAPSSITLRGLFDINGDGRPDALGRAPQNRFSMHELIGADGRIGAHSSGRLVRVENGYGAVTSIEYESAKKDTRSPHRLPFPEIVVSKVFTTGTQEHGGSLAPVQYAYGSAEMVYDPAWDTWSFPGYGRTITLRGLSATDGGPSRVPPGHISGTAVLTNRYHRRPNFSTDPVDQESRITFRYYALRGRIDSIHFLDGEFDDDPWVLNQDPYRRIFNERTDTYDIQEIDDRWHGSLEYRYESRSFKTLNIGNIDFDCTKLDGFPQHTVVIDASGTSCQRIGFAFVGDSRAWRGREPSRSTLNNPDPDKNLEISTRVQEIDVYGRPLRIRHENDFHRRDDDLCETISYLPNEHILDAVHTRRLHDCDNDDLVFAGTRFRYDGLPEGEVERGLLTHRIVERYDPQRGEKLHEFLQDITSYDAQGNVHRVWSVREDGVEQVQEITYDPFGLVPEEITVSASDVPTVLRTAVDYDPLSLRPRALTDENGTIWKTYYDGFSRPVRNSVIPSGANQEFVLGTTDYLGDDGGWRRIRSRAFHSEITLEFLENDPDAEGIDQKTESTAYFDELGRLMYVEHLLGDDYDGDILVTNKVRYDLLGRVEFITDPFSRNDTEDQSWEYYGTRFTYQPDNTLLCTIRGRSSDVLNISELPEPSEDLARYVSCSIRQYANHQLTTRVLGPNETLSGSPQNGAYSTVTTTAIGHVLETSRWVRSEDHPSEDTRVEHSEYDYDRLGQLTTVRRYKEPAAPAEPVAWNVSRDSLGQVIRLEEPRAATRTLEYDNWGNLTATRWQDPGLTQPADPVERQIRSEYDGFGRLTRTVELADGTPKPDTDVAYFYDEASRDPNHRFADFLVGRLSYAVSPSMSVFYGYDRLGRLQTERRVGSSGEHYTQNYRYNIGGLLRQMTFLLPDTGYQNEIVGYRYDSAMRVARIDWRDPSATIEPIFKALEIDPYGRYRHIRLGNGVEEKYAYKDRDRRELESYKLIFPNETEHHTYFRKYDATLRLLERHHMDDPSYEPSTTYERYQFDPLYRLARYEITEYEVGVFDEEYEYDGLGNRIAIIDHLNSENKTITTRHDDRDRICGIHHSARRLYRLAAAAPIYAGAGCWRRHDALGNVVYTNEGEQGGIREFAYDGASRVTSMTAGSATATFRYGPFGEVTELDIQGAGPKYNRQDRRYGPLVEQFEIASGDEPGAVLERRVLGPMGVLLSRRGAGAEAQTIYWHGDWRANRQFTDPDGTIVQDVRYGPFGEILESSGDTGTATHTKYLWNGGDTLAPFGVVHLGARLYDPDTGRFLQRDPLFVPGTSGGTHPYAFAVNDPVNLTDPLGLQPYCDDLNPSCPGSTGSGTTGPTYPDPFYVPPGAFFPEPVERSIYRDVSDPGPEPSPRQELGRVLGTLHVGGGSSTNGNLSRHGSAISVAVLSNLKNQGVEKGTEFAVLAGFGGGYYDLVRQGSNRLAQEALTSVDIVQGRFYVEAGTSGLSRLSRFGKIAGKAAPPIVDLVLEAPNIRSGIEDIASGKTIEGVEELLLSGMKALPLYWGVELFMALTEDYTADLFFDAEMQAYRNEVRTWGKEFQELVWFRQQGGIVRNGREVDLDELIERHEANFPQRPERR